MKLLTIAPCLGACALMMVTSCRSTGDKYLETAQPMSEMEVADDQLPPWLLVDDGSHGAQVSAGSQTPTASNRNLYAIPEPDETKPSKRSTRQNQPAMSGEQDGTHVEVATNNDPLLNEQSHVTGSSQTQKSTSSGSKTKPRPSSGTKPKKPTMVTYKVRPGDNLSVIAARSNTTVSQIMKDSHLSSTTIHPGQTIKVRYTPKGYKAPKGGSGSGSGKTHTVTSGQTLSGIAAKYGVTTSSLMKANGLSAADARKIRPGQKLKIPAKKR